MTIKKRLLALVWIGIALVWIAPVALGGDESFSAVVKHIKTNYHGKQQGFFGAMMLARFAVKIIRPAGVKNFKVALLRDLDYSRSPAPETEQFHSFVRSKIDPRWTPLVQYSSPRERQWSYVYVTRENEDVKLLVVAIQRTDAFVLQTKFSPERLIEFINNPQIVGVSLDDKKDKRGEEQSDDPNDNKPRPRQQFLF
jgi:hypothetical protein